MVDSVITRQLSGIRFFYQILWPRAISDPYLFFCYETKVCFLLMLA